MGVFVIIGRDGPQGLELRKDWREAHLANLEPLDKRGQVRFGGPLRDPDGKPVGSVIVIEADNLTNAQAFAQSDPYTVNGVFESVEVFETLDVFPCPR